MNEGLTVIFGCSFWSVREHLNKRAKIASKTANINVQNRRINGIIYSAAHLT